MLRKKTTYYKLQISPGYYSVWRKVSDAICCRKCKWFEKCDNTFFYKSPNDRVNLGRFCLLIRDSYPVRISPEPKNISKKKIKRGS